MNRPLRVFLCHSSNDKPAVRELYQKLRAEPWIQPWLDEEELYPGQDWNMEIEKAVESADAIIVCLTKNSINKEGYVQRELRIVLDFADYKPEGTLYIIPVRLEECEPPRRLRAWQYADYFEGQRERAFERLLISLKRRADSLGLQSSLPELIDRNQILDKSESKPEIKHSRFQWRDVHLEYKVNADSVVINNYLLQHYTGISVFNEIDNVTYQVDRIDSFSPKENDVFQYGFIAHGFKETAINGYSKIGEARVTVDPIMESIPEMFVITISQGQKDVSILSFDTDVKHAHMFTVGLVRELGKAFSVNLLNPSRYVPVRKKEKPVEEKKPVIETPRPVEVVTSPDKITLSNGMEFMRVPAGKFLMGSNNGDSDEKPQHTVDIPYDYWMARFPVTNELYNVYVKTKGINHPVSSWEKKKDHPVVSVKWTDAVKYCQWLDSLLKKELPSGLALRLPSEAEWEKAARGVDGRLYPWGNEFDNNKCNAPSGYWAGLANAFVSSTTPASKYTPQGDSPYGCVDMAGNVWELCHSLFRSYPYNAADGREDGFTNGDRVHRGGSFVHLSNLARCASRSSDRSLGEKGGFRVCLAPPLLK